MYHCKLCYFVCPSPLLDKVFGVPLELLWRGDVPFIIRKIVGHIEQNGLDTEGIYRINGNAKNIEKLKSLFDKGIYNYYTSYWTSVLMDTVLMDTVLNGF